MAGDGSRRGPLHWLEPWFAAYALAGLLVNGIVPLLIPLTAAENGPGAVAVVVAAFFVGQLTAPFVGRMADRRRRRGADPRQRVHRRRTPAVGVGRPDRLVPVHLRPRAGGRPHDRRGLRRGAGGPGLVRGRCGDPARHLPRPARAAAPAAGDA